jgi:hypothetical protein
MVHYVRLGLTILNCKPNDLCLIIYGVDSGKTLTVFEVLPAGSVIPGREDFPADPQNKFAPELGPIWLTDRPINWYYEGQPTERIPYCPDKVLVPITPGDDNRLAFETEKHLDNAEHYLKDLRDRHGREVVK